VLKRARSLTILPLPFAALTPAHHGACWAPRRQHLNFPLLGQAVMAIRDWHVGQLVTFLVALVAIEAFLFTWADHLPGIRIIFTEEQALQVQREDGILVMLWGVMAILFFLGLVVSWRWFGRRRSR